jgi:hypothetical protein
MNAPTDILVADLKTGCQAFVKWTAPDGAAQGYNVYVSALELGTYVKNNLATLIQPHYVIDNLDLGEEIFVKVSAIDELGAETALSLVGDDAQIAAAQVEMVAEAVLGDTIAANSYFGALVGDGVIFFKTSTAFTFDGIMMLWQLDANNYVQLNFDEIVYVLGGQVVARIRQEAIYLRKRKIVLTDLGAVASAVEAPFEWVAGQNALYAIHATSTDVRLMGIDASGNMYLPEHDSQPVDMLGATAAWGLIESGDTLQWVNGFYVLAQIDKTEKLFMTRGRIIENVGSL